MENAANPTPPAPARKRSRRAFSTRGFTSLLIAWTFLILSFAGAMLYVTPRGRDANWTDWTLLGLGKEQWASVHVNVSILFLAFVIVHVLLNWRIFWMYLKKRKPRGVNFKWELALATMIAAGAVIGAIWDVPPFSTVMNYNDDIKNYWSRKTAEQGAAAPVVHAEALTLAQLAGEIDLPLEDVIEALGEEGYEVENGEMLISELAEGQGVAPRDVFAAIRNHFPAAGLRGPGGSGAGAGRGGGYGHAESGGFGLRGGRGPGSSGEGFGGDAEGHGPGFGRGGGRRLGRGMGR